MIPLFKNFNLLLTKKMKTSKRQRKSKKSPNSSKNIPCINHVKKEKLPRLEYDKKYVRSFKIQICLIYNSDTEFQLKKQRLS